MTMFRLALLFVLLPSIGMAAPCPKLGEIVLNEIRYAPTESSFIELWGPPGAALECLKLASFNGGQDGTSCDESTVYQFVADDVVGEDGYFLLAVSDGEGVDRVSGKADLQNGPDGIQLKDSETGLVFDSLAYGGPLEACETPVMEGNASASLHGETSSLGRLVDHQDTNNNGADWGVCPAPTPGMANSCPVPPECTAGPGTDGIVISEVRVGPSGEEFVELKGSANADLGCYFLRTLNGGSANDKCDEDERVTLVGQAFDPAGYHVTYFDLQKGPDALELVYGFTDGTEEVSATVVWKEPMPQCGGAIQGNSAVQVPADGDSFSKCYGFGDYSKDYVLTEASPGEANLCPAPCSGPTGTVVINEAVIDPNELAFVELRGEPGLDLSCYALLELNSGQSQEVCDLETNVALDGLVMPDDGYLVLGAPDVASLDLEVKLAAQNGPGDGLRLVYEGDDGDLVVDTFSWGATLSACVDPPSTDSGYGPIVKEANSIARCPDGRDTDNNIVDLFEAESATPGATNDCPDLAALAVCDNPPTSPVVINEIQSSPSASAFIELKGMPNTAMGCFTLLAYNGGPDGEQCEISDSMILSGAAIGASGHFVIATEGSDLAESADFLDNGADLQDGPDALALVFTSTDGTMLLMDAVVYGGFLPLCDDFGEKDPTVKIGKDKSLTRCAGGDTQNNEVDFTLCSVPSPGGVTTCNCGAPNPTGGTVEVEEPTGCQTHRGVVPAFFVLLFGLILVLRKRISRIS